MVLTPLVSELRLQEKIGACRYAGSIGSGQAFADPSLEIMPFAGLTASMPRKPARRASSVRAAVRSSFQAVP